MENSKFERAITLATAVCIILLGVAFIVCTAHLYFTGGEEPYTRERVGDYLVILAAPAVITVGLAIAGAVMKFIRGREADGLTTRTNSELLESYTSRYDFSAIDGEAAEVVHKERRYRKTYSAVAYSLSAVIFVVVLAYISFFADFTIDNLNGDVISALAFALPMCAIAIGVHVPRLYLSEDSCRRELEAIKRYVRESAPPRAEKREAESKKPDYALIARYVILGASVALIILGITNGGMKDVLAKAVKICTECIGLG